MIFVLLSEFYVRLRGPWFPALVKEVWLRAGVSLDMETLAQYDGKGKCESVPLWDDTRERYGARVDSWAGDMGWDVSGDSGNFTNIERVHSRRRGLFGGGCKV